MLPTSATILSAVHACLSADAFVRTALGTPPRLYDHPPEDALHPYVAYGAFRLEDVSGDAAPLATATLNIHVHSRYQGRAEAMSLVATLLAALERDRLRPHLPGVASVVSRYSDSFVSRDGHARHSILRLSITVESDPDTAPAAILMAEAGPGLEIVAQELAA